MGKLLLRILAVFLGLSALQRIVYAGWVYWERKEFVTELPLALLKGIPFDLMAGLFLFLPLLIFVGLSPSHWAERRWWKRTAKGMITFFLGLAVFTAVAELFFFNEFQARYNFIAVDYLVYTHEVVRNIWESYSGWVLLIAVASALTPALLLSGRILRGLDLSGTTWTQRIGALVAVGLVLGLSLGRVDEDRFLARDSYWLREFSKNSLFSLFAAYHKNSIKYDEFYASTSPERALKAVLDDAGVSRSPSFERLSQPKLKNLQGYNLVVVLMESLSARFLTRFGAERELTPNLDRYAKEGISFDRMYSTGTRTVRGIEAVLLGTPPTPGQSIIRRPGSEGIFHLGSVLADAGYQNQFLYGGYSYFDGMKNWFSQNGFAIVDRSNFRDEAVHFENAWGVCDEDLFDRSIEAANELAKAEKPFFQFILTASNHRPYTFPSGKIDIPSGTGRDGAVKYSDFAIGEFMRKAKDQTWFKKTVFVFVADHNASVAGGMDLPLRDFHIPAIVYAPGIVRPQIYKNLSSQIDLAPTLLGLLGLEYQSRFFGRDLLHAEAPNRAYIGTYQKIARVEEGHLTILSPGREVEERDLSPDGNVLSKKQLTVNPGQDLDGSVGKTVGIFQMAAKYFESGAIKLKREVASGH